MGERIGPVTPNEIAFEVLNSVYNMATGGEIANPGETIRTMRKFTDGPRIEILRYRGRLDATIVETEGREKSFGIQRDGLADISFHYRGGPNVRVNASELEESDRTSFMNSSLRLVPWIVERFLNKEAKPLPLDLQILYSRLATFKKRVEAKEILTEAEALADNFNRQVGGQLKDEVALAELTQRDTRERVVGPMRECWMSLDIPRKQYLVSSIHYAIGGLRHFDEPEPTVGYLRSLDVRVLERIRGIGPKRAAFLKRAFAKQS